MATRRRSNTVARQWLRKKLRPRWARGLHRWLLLADVRAFFVGASWLYGASFAELFLLVHRGCVGRCCDLPYAVWWPQCACAWCVWRADMGKWLWSNSEGIRAKVSSGTTSLTSAIVGGNASSDAGAAGSSGGDVAETVCNPSFPCTPSLPPPCHRPACVHFSWMFMLCLCYVSLSRACCATHAGGHHTRRCRLRCWCRCRKVGVRQGRQGACGWPRAGQHRHTRRQSDVQCQSGAV